ncbi:MAG TPA: hypothetical protein VFI06_09710 [Chitinophagaceae bacterium]|nr:hypothetical protein [Chitinophagaceae bacterium]
MIKKKKSGGRRIKKVLKWVLITFLVIVTSIATIILYPQPLFANKIEYRQFKVYSNDKIGNEINPVLDSAVSLVKNSELYDSTYKVDIFFAPNTFFNKLDSKVFGKGPTARATDNNLVIKVQVEINKRLAYTTFHKPCQQDLAYVIAHEMIHCLQMHKYGILKFNPFKHPEMWKLEGYPEYIARQKYSEPNYSLKKDIERFIELNRKQTDIWISVEEGGCEAPEYYYKGRLMIEYLVNVKHLTYDQILKDKRLEEEIYTEMAGWANKQDMPAAINQQLK